MSVTIHHGDSRSGYPLHQRVGPSVTRLAQRNEVHQVIGLAVVGEEPERPHVMNVTAGRPAMLAEAVVPCLRLSLLCRPVRASVMRGAPLELRVQFADAVLIPTVSRAVQPPAAADPRRGTPETDAAADAIQAVSYLRSRGHRLVLTGRRAVLASPMLRPGRRDGEGGSAMRAINQNAGSAGRESDRG